MPALPPANGVAKIIVKQTLAGVNVFNVLHAWNGSTTNWSLAELTSLANTTRAAWVTNVIPLQTTGLTLTDVQCVDLTGTSGSEYTATGSTAGSAAGIQGAANACVCWSWKQPLRYRGGHPRTYIAGLTSNHTTNANTITSVHKTAHLNAATALRTAINGVSVAAGTAQLVMVSYYLAKVLRTTPYIATITGVSVDDRIDSQRRRLGRDRN